MDHYETPYGPYGPPPPARKNGAYRRELFILGCIIGAAFPLYLILSRAFSYILGGIPWLGSLYVNDLSFSYLMEMAYSFLCVGLPFLLSYLILKRLPLGKEIHIPLGPTFSAGDTFLLIIAGLGLAMLGSVITNYIAVYADALGFGFTSFYEAMDGEEIPDSAPGFILMVLHTALLPALIEELAFRGVVLQSLRKYGDGFAIGCSAFLFGLMHANMTQVPFAVIAGLALGYVTVVTGSLKTGMIVHFLNNFISVLLSVLQKDAGDLGSRMISGAVIYALIGLGVLAFFIFALKRPGALRFRPGVYGGERKKARWFFLAPPMAVGVLWLLFYTVTDIEAIGALLGR